MGSSFSGLDLSSFMNGLLTKAITCVRQGSLFCSVFHFGPKTLVCKCLANAMVTLALSETIAKTRFVMLSPGLFGLAS